jgi:hypothetical protein
LIARLISLHQAFQLAAPHPFTSGIKPGWRWSPE